MNDNFDANAGSARKREDFARPTFNRANGHSANGNGRPHSNGHTRKPIADAWVVFDLILHRWYWMTLGALVCAGALFALGWHEIKPKFTASAQLLRYESPAAHDFFQGRPMSVETFAGLIRSPDLLARVGTNVTPEIPPERLIKRIKIDPQSDSDIVKVFLAAGNAQESVDLLNAFLNESVAFTREYQAQQAQTLANNYLKKLVERMDEDITSLQNTFRGVPSSAHVTNKLSEIGTNLNALNTTLAASPRNSPAISMLNEKLNKSLTDLMELTSKYTDIHPAVKAKQSEIAAIKNQLAEAGTNMSLPSLVINSLASRYPESTFNPERDIIQTKMRSVEDGRVQIANRLHEAELFASDPPGMARILSPATLKTVQTNWRSAKVAIISVFGAFIGIGLSLGLIMLVELTDRRLHTASDVERVTGLPVLSSLGDLAQMVPESQSLWAFRAWTMLQGKLSRSANHGLVCGITSCTEGEGRSTWISLLAEAASLTGFRVLTIATKPSPTHVDYSDESQGPLALADQVEQQRQAASSTALAKNVLASPAQVTEQLTGPQSQPVVHIPLPGWVWNLERRKEWREALNHWRRIDNLVILVELPPASVPEAVLLGSNLPNLLWLTDSGSADAAETRTQLETLRHARCNLVGAVLNRDCAPSVKKRFPRWLGAIAFLSAFVLQNANAQLTKAPQPSPSLIAAVSPAPQVQTAVATNMYFSVVNPSQRAAWQQRLTLGPGDVLTLSLYGQPELTRSEVAVAPDGHISFLEADVMAAGLTIDELRAKLDDSLGQLRRSPRTMIAPVAFKSKKYYMLGKVMTKGVYTLDRPLTVLEAIARAHGLENGLVDRNVVDLADFQRSFLMRGGRRIPLNFEKLFLEGDLSQNIAIEPGDYLYFPSTNVKEVYVVGEVRLPGPVTYTPATTIIAAISARGGYTDRAYKARVLVVRGSINNPETFAVDTHAILDGRATDFKLRPKDIIYVNSRPFIRVEELAELAATAFIQSLITTWVGVDIVKPIQ